jgi:hypothetical protein
MDESVRLSVGASKRVRGHEVKRMPLGAWLKAAERIDGLADEVIGACFPGFTADEMLNSLIKIDADGLKTVVARLAAVAPKHIIGIVADLSGIPLDTLVNDPEIGLDGLFEVVQAVAEVNRLGEIQARFANILTTAKAGFRK